jgi:gas vesicle protein
MNISTLKPISVTQGMVKLLIGLVFGGLTGFGVMLLLAPQSGKKTRILIQEKRNEFQERAINTFDDLVILSQYDPRAILADTRVSHENLLLPGLRYES